MLKSPLPLDLETFGERLDWLIENHPALGTRAELARVLEAKPPYVTQLVQREDPPGKEAIAKLSRLLNVPAAWLAYGVVDGDGRGGAVLSSELWRRIDAINALDVSEIVKVVKIEALSAALRAEAANAEARAAEARGRALESEGAGAEGRARAVEEEAKSASERTQALKPESTPAVPTTTPSPTASDEDEPGEQGERKAG